MLPTFLFMFDFFIILWYNKRKRSKYMNLKKQILELFKEYYNHNAGQTYLGYSKEERYKLIAQSFDDLLMNIYTLVKNYEENF